MRPHSHRATKRCLSSHARLLTTDAFFEYLLHNAKHHAIDVGESVYYTCSSGRDKSSIQACSKSGDILCGGGEPGVREAGGRTGCSGDIMGAATAAGVSRQTEVLCQTSTRRQPFLIQLNVLSKAASYGGSFCWYYLIFLDSKCLCK